MEAIIAAGLELLAEVIKQIEAAQSAEDEEHEAILERVQASRAALAGDKLDAHKAVKEWLEQAQTVIDKARK
jgi:DNA/RNA-binding domain of Phe-tRNA-synthetase-like protein